MCVLDFYLPKEKFTGNWHIRVDGEEHEYGMCNYLKQPLYMNSKFYDKYISIEVPCLYAISLSDADARETSGSYPLFTFSADDIDQQWYVTENANTRIEFAVVSNPESGSDISQIETVVLQLPDKDVDVTQITLDTVNTASLGWSSNTDFFNVRIYQDKERGCVVYYPTFGDTDHSQPLDYNVWAQIESGEIPVIANGFYDLKASENGYNSIDTGPETLYYVDGEVTTEVQTKWKVYNDLIVAYVNSVQMNDTTSSYVPYEESYSRIIDYAKCAASTEEFYKTKFFVDDVLARKLGADKICFKYTCRLVNEMHGIESIRVAALNIDYPSAADNDVNQHFYVNNYKLINKTQDGPTINVRQSETGKEKYIRSYYNATQLAAKNIGTGGTVYQQGQMTLGLNKSSNNYLIQLFNYNENNIRVPYDLTGPYRYKMVFAAGAEGNTTISVSPNGDSREQNLGTGTLVFYITGEQAAQIMECPEEKRYFAVMTDTSGTAGQSSTLYEGKVAWLSA